MTQAIIDKSSPAYFDNEVGRVKVPIETSTNIGYKNLCEQYNDWGHISVPLPYQMANIDHQANSNVVVTGYNNQITDTNFSIVAGESANYSTKWYQVRSINGVYLQPTNTSHKENEMMGQSTNAVLLDMANLLVSIVNYLSTHTHSNVKAGGEISGVPVQLAPDDSNVVSDVTYITDNKNLAITDVYTPYG